ncbi:MAG: hypothetical protein IJR49_03590 [Treponema sp.]|nr:hypothetical protein [Treponema sp.]
MKKHNFHFRNTVICVAWFSIVLCTFTLFFSCKSRPVDAKDVHPLDLLDSGAAFYVKLPTEVDPILLSRLIQNNVKGLGEQEANAIASRIECTYTSITRTRNTTEMQASILANIPQKTISSVLKKNKDWQVSKFSAPFNSYEYYSSSLSDTNLSFLSKKNAIIAKDIEPIINRFDTLAFSEGGRAELTGDIYDWLFDGENEIRFYAPNPLSFLTILTGANLNLRLSYVKGSMISDKRFPEQYIMSIDFEFGQERFVRVGKSMIALAFGLTDSEMEQATATHISVRGIKIDKKQLYKLFVL